MNCAAFLQMAVQCELYQFASCALTHYRNYIRANDREDFVTKVIDTVSAILYQLETNMTGVLGRKQYFGSYSGQNTQDSKKIRGIQCMV